MKHHSYLAVILIALLMICGCIPVQIQAASQAPIVLFMNGKQIASEVAPQIRNGRTMVPLRVIADNLGRYVSWDKESQRVIITKTADEAAALPSRGRSGDTISIVVDGREIQSEIPPYIENGRTMVPIRVIAEGLGMKIAWDPDQRLVSIDKLVEDEPAVTKPEADSTQDPASIPAHNSLVDPDTAIMGTSQVSAAQLKTLLGQKNPDASPELADLYLEIGREYGLRGDIAFCQAAKETKWWHFGGLVQEFQNNFCGLGASGTSATGDEDLRGADPARVRYQADIHGPIFDSLATGVEAHIQHLYAYAVKGALPPGKTLVDPRFTFPARGGAIRWVDLGGGKWAGDPNYGQSILNDYYAQLISNS